MRHQALRELRNVSHKEDVRTLVLSFRPDAPMAQAIAKLGREDPKQAKLYSISNVQALYKAVEAIEGRLAPEACLLSGVAPQRIGKKPPSSQGPSTRQSPRGCGGCNTTPGETPTPLLWMALFLLLGWLGNRRFRSGKMIRGIYGLLLLVCLVGCNSPSCQPVSTPQSKSVDALEPPGPPLKDPKQRAERELANQSKLLKAAEKLRKQWLLPAIQPKTVFARLNTGKPGAATKACLTLVHSMGYEPYEGVQRGVKGCLSTRRCNAVDRALVLQACLKHHGISSSLRSCPYNAITAAHKKELWKAATQAPKEPSTQKFGEALRKHLYQILKATPEQPKGSPHDQLWSSRELKLYQKL